MYYLCMYLFIYFNLFMIIYYYFFLDTYLLIYLFIYIFIYLSIYLFTIIIFFFFFFWGGGGFTRGKNVWLLKFNEVWLKKHVFTHSLFQPRVSTRINCLFNVADRIKLEFHQRHTLTGNCNIRNNEWILRCRLVCVMMFLWSNHWKMTNYLK